MADTASLTLPSYRALLRSSWNRFWQLAESLVVVYALVELSALTVSYLTGGWDSVRLSLGWPIPESAAQLDFSLTWSNLRRLGLEFFGLGLINTLGFGLAALIISQRLTIAAALRRFWSRITPLILVSLISSLLILVGFILFIVPGVIASIWFLFAGYIVVLEGRSPIESLRQSRRLTHGIFWPLLFRWLLIILLVGALGLIISGIPIAGPLANALLLAPFSTVFTFELYQACLSFQPIKNGPSNPTE